MFLAAILVLVIYVGIIVAATVIASRKGRSAIGWCILTIIFPIAILFVAIAAPAHAYAQPSSASTVQSNPSQNELDAQVVAGVRKNPAVFGFLALIPLILYAFDQPEAFALPWLLIDCLPKFMFWFGLFWLLGIGIVYNKKIICIIALIITPLIWIINYLLVSYWGPFVTILEIFYLIENFIEFGFSYYSPVFCSLILVFVYILQRRIKLSSEN